MTHFPKDDHHSGVLPVISCHRYGDHGERVGHPLPSPAGRPDSSRQAPLSSQSEENHSRLLVLDGLRALAICLVLFHHYSQKTGNPGLADHFFFSLSNSAWIGVDLFFVLSGFLITGILYDAKGSPSYFRTFYIRRSLRIFPIYYLMLLVIFVILPLSHHGIVDSYTLAHKKWFWLYGSNYLTALKAWPDIAVAHLWSPVQQAAGLPLIALFFAAGHVVCLRLSGCSIFYRILTCSPALWLGRLSYGMYFFHRPIEVIAMEMGLHPGLHIHQGVPNWTYVLVYILGNSLATALLAWLTWNLFEKHILRLKDHFIYQKI